MIFFDEKKSRKGIFLLGFTINALSDEDSSWRNEGRCSTAALPFGSKEDHLRE